VCTGVESGRVGATMTVEYSYWSSYPVVIVVPCLDCAIKLKIIACDCHKIFLTLDLPFNISEARWTRDCPKGFNAKAGFMA
jgi:hypothetical protein